MQSLFFKGSQWLIQILSLLQNMMKLIPVFNYETVIFVKTALALVLALGF